MRSQIFIMSLAVVAASTAPSKADFVPVTLNFESADGYPAPGQTAINVKDKSLKVNQDSDASNDVAWRRVGEGTDTDNLAVSAVAGGTALRITGGGTATPNQARVASLDLTGQEIPTDRVWLFEATLQFDSQSRSTVDDVHVTLGGAVDEPLVHVALSRAGGNTDYHFDVLLETADGFLEVQHQQVQHQEFVTVKVEVTPVGVSGELNGKLRFWIDGVEQSLSNDELPSTTAVPTTLFLHSSPTSTGFGRLDAVSISVVPEPGSLALLTAGGVVAFVRRRP